MFFFKSFFTLGPLWEPAPLKKISKKVEFSVMSRENGLSSTFQLIVQQQQCDKYFAPTYMDGREFTKYIGKSVPNIHFFTHFDDLVVSLSSPFSKSKQSKNHAALQFFYGKK